MRRRWLCGLLLLGACSPPPDDPLVVRIQNLTGRELIGFQLSGGGSQVDVDRLPDKSDFKSGFRVKTPGKLVLRYDGREQPVDFTLGFEHNVGELRVTLRANGPAEFFFRPITRLQPSDTVEGNLADARRLYDLLDPGMPVERALELLGEKTLAKPDWGISMNYGSYNRPETVTLGVEFKEGRLVRVYLEKSNKILFEKK